MFTAGNANDQICPGGFNRLDIFFQKPLDIPADRCYNKYVIKSKMKKETLIRWYRQMNCSEMYILGFIRNHRVYLIHYDGEIPPRYIRYCQASRGMGGQIRFDPLVKYKDQLIRKGATCIGDESELFPASCKNRGELFKKLVFEMAGQEWQKDCVPCWVAGDINIDGVEIQIKFEKATFTNEQKIKNWRSRG